jgi:phage regulator Rha-like protein
MPKEIVKSQIIEERIFLIRGKRVMIDRDLAELYGVETKYLNRQVRRNKERFPETFMFRLNRRERDELVTICHRLYKLKHSSVMPLAFTEHGVAMLSSVLNSERAIKISIGIIETFIKLRQTLNMNKHLADKLAELEKKIEKHDDEIKLIFDAIRELTTINTDKDIKEIRVIGFQPERDHKK